MSKHTKGPWEVGSLVKNDHTPRYVEVLADGVKIIAKATYGKTDEEAAINAHLIAASPGLLEACKAVIACVNSNNITEQIDKEDAEKLSNILADAYKAIAKAEGK